MRCAAAHLLPIVLCGCARPVHPAPEPSPQAPAAVQAALPPIVQNLAPLPTSVDLRPRLADLGLTPRPQSHRGTCSIFTTCEAIEFAFARKNGRTDRLSPEYLNWAASRAAGQPSDGNFFHNALAGFQQHGICTDEAMPYARDYSPARAPTQAAADQAAALRDESRDALQIVWIVPWAAGKSGVDPDQFLQIKRTLAAGYPVAAGSAHSRLLVGYADDPAHPGGGTFITEDSALNRFDSVTYEFVQRQVNDAFCILVSR